MFMLRSIEREVGPKDEVDAEVDWKDGSVNRGGLELSIARLAGEAGLTGSSLALTFQEPEGASTLCPW